MTLYPRRATARVPTPVIITHIFLGSLVERNYRAELVHKRYHAKCLVTSVHRNAPKDMGNDDIIVRAGAAWSGVGTLAVALLPWTCKLPRDSMGKWVP